MLTLSTRHLHRLVFMNIDKTSICNKEFHKSALCLAYEGRSMTTFSRSLAFLLGFGITFLPFYGPFLGLLLFFSTRWTLRRFDVLWWGRGVALCAATGSARRRGGLFLRRGEILAPWLVYRAFSQLAANRARSRLASPIGIGLLSGLALVVLFGWLQLGSLGAGAARHGDAGVCGGVGLEPLRSHRLRAGCTRRDPFTEYAPQTLQLRAFGSGHLGLGQPRGRARLVARGGCLAAHGRQALVAQPRRRN